MLIDLFRMIARDAGRREPANGGRANVACPPFILRLLRRVMPILIVVDVMLFLYGIFTGGVGLAILLFASRIFLRGAFEDVAEAEESLAGQAPETRNAASHPFDRWVNRVSLVSRFGFASFLGVVSAVLFLAGTLMGVSFFTKYFENEGYIPARGRAAAVVVDTTSKCRLRGRNGQADAYLDAALCQLRRDARVRREVVPFVTLRFPLSDGTLHTVEGRSYTMVGGKVAVSDRVPITYDFDNPDKIHRRIPDFLGKAGKSFPIPFVFLALSYGAARWRRRLRGDPSPASEVLRKERAVPRGTAARRRFPGDPVCRPGKDEPRREMSERFFGDAGLRNGRPDAAVATFMTGPRARQTPRR